MKVIALYPGATKTDCVKQVVSNMIYSDGKKAFIALYLCVCVYFLFSLKEIILIRFHFFFFSYSSEVVTDHIVEIIQNADNNGSIWNSWKII